MEELYSGISGEGRESFRFLPKSMASSSRSTSIYSYLLPLTCYGPLSHFSPPSSEMSLLLPLLNHPLIMLNAFSQALFSPWSSHYGDPPTVHCNTPVPRTWNLPAVTNQFLHLKAWLLQSHSCQTTKNMENLQPPPATPSHWHSSDIMAFNNHMLPSVLQ